MRELVADAFGTEHHELELSFDDERRPRGSRLAPRRAARRSLVARVPRALASSRAEHVTVALSGQGADELFGGYSKHRAAALSAAGSGCRARSRRRSARSRRMRPRRVARGRTTLRAPRSRRPALVDERKVDGALRASSTRGPLAELERTARSASSIARVSTASPRSAAGDALHSTRQLGLPSTTCSTTSTAPPWRTRSRFACRSSTTSWSSSCATIPAS